ncbi:MAG: carbamoyltransferase HypF [Sulfuricellaceae bacterium]
MPLATDHARLRCRVRGQVQGVGFRPFVYRLAVEIGLTGWVRNDAAGVLAEVQGKREPLDAFLARLKSELPPLARIDSLEAEETAAVAEQGFTILASAGGRAATAIAPDTAVCPACLGELFDPADRRYRYPFINCTHCGPRYTITAYLPYDRSNTSMARFKQCTNCQAEYDDPADRRFHAQPNACPVCGPRLHWRGSNGQLAEVADPIAHAVARLRAGDILAVKGLGGFHLLCDARNADAVARLRTRKAREEKPFAVMALNPASFSSLGRWDEAEQALLQSPERPIVLLRKAPGAHAVLAGVADGMPWLGTLLPYTPLHYLLFHEAAGRPAGTAWLEEAQELLLVCTSANPGGEPLVTDNDEALRRLGAIADGYLVHDRDILVRCDDSVVRVKDESGRTKGEGRYPALQFVRRARGYTPRSIRLPRQGPSVLAVGGYFKNTLCLTRGDEAFLSQHIGELDNAPTCESLEATAAHMMAVLEIRPAVVAHDLHPDFHSTRFAVRFASERGVPAVAVQHHHAHIAAVAAEHGLDEPVLGLALDGIGMGTDGGAWGGELLRVDGASFSRLGHLKPLAMPGGDRAAREPWRMAASALHALGRREEISRRFKLPAAAMLAEMLEKKVNSPLTSSGGRLFDAAAGLLGVSVVQGFEGQAAMLLEGLAQAHGPAEAWTEGYTVGEQGLDFLPLLGRLAEEGDTGYAAAIFHATLAAGLAEWTLRGAEREKISKVVLGGGCFLNALLSEALARHLRQAGLVVYEARQAPPNDGGLALGQAWVAMNSVKG